MTTSLAQTERIADLLAREGDGWADALAHLCEVTGAEVAVAIVLGPPPRRLGAFGPLPMQACLATDEASLRVALAAAGLGDGWVGAFQRGNRRLGLVALASRRAENLGPAERSLLDTMRPVLALALERAALEAQIELEIASRRNLEARLSEVDRRSTLGAVAAAVAHDLSAPVSALIMEHGEMNERIERLRALIPEAGPMIRNALDDLQGLADHCVESTESARQLLTDFRLAAHPAGQSTSSWMMVNVVDTVRSCVRLVSPLSRDKARVDLIIEPDVPLIPGSRKRLEHAITNLLVNAIHAAAVREGRAGLVEARVRRASNEILVEIADNGPGIAPEVKARIFEPFFTTKAPDVGTGLGLPIARDAVEAHGGRLEVESERGRGAVFRVRLPVAAMPVQATRGKRSHVLVVDDDDGVARALERILRADHDVTVAGGGRRALELLAAGAVFECMIVDLYMPDVDGPSFFAEVQRRWPGTERRIVFATGGTFTSAVRAFLDSVPNVRFEKPITREELRPLVQRVVTAA